MTECPLFWEKKYIACFDQISVLLASDPHTKGVIEVIDHELKDDLNLCTMFLSGQISNFEFNSSLISTFGGIFAPMHEKLDIFLVNSINFLSKKYGVTSFKFRLPPDHLMDFNQKSQIQCLLDLGFRICLIEMNYSIELGNWSTDLMSKGNRKKLKQCVDNDLIFRNLEFNSLETIYNLLEANRLSLGTKLSVNFLKLSKLIESFPDKYFLFGVFYQNSLIAAAVCVETFPTNLYVFYWGDDKNFRHFSPITFLANEIIKFAKFRNYDYLDLGTVGPDGQYIKSLARYKQNLGASVSFKVSLEAKLTQNV
jgi:hypothetical protein